jgi:molecular chaperone GrpE
MLDNEKNLSIDEVVIEDDFLNVPKQTDIPDSPEDQEFEEIDIEKLREELKDLTDKYVRICADYSNFRRRHGSQMKEIEDFVGISILKQFLPLLDSFNAMSFENATKESLEEGLMSLKNQITHILSKVGVAEIPTDEGYSSKYHEAVATVANPEKEDGEITKVYMKGYKYREKVLRPSMVEVVTNE